MNTKLTMTLGLAMLAAACATTPQPNPALETARTAVRSAEADPNVSKYSALDLEAAKKDLAIAESAYQNKKDDQVTQPAYMATQNARLAQTRAAAKADDAHVAGSQAERDQIMLTARTRDADNAKMAAANANAQAASARAEASVAMAQRDQANEDAQRAQAELDQMKATPTPRGMLMTLGDVLFDTGRAELKPGAGQKMDQLAHFLNEHPDRKLQIEGFTDSVGSEAYNEELSQRRAEAVKSALLTRGVNSSRIETKGYGKSYPVASNSESGGRQLNRRVEVIIGDDSGRAIAPRS